jgi:hypothetical protein
MQRLYRDLQEIEHRATTIIHSQIQLRHLFDQFSESG